MSNTTTTANTPPAASYPTLPLADVPAFRADGPVNVIVNNTAAVLVWVGGDVAVSEAPDGLGCSAALGALHPLLHVAPDVAAVERMIPHGDTARQSLIVLGEAAGEAVAWCRRRHGVDPLRVTAGEWRRTVGVPARPARLCAHAARALVGDRTSGVRTGVRVAGLPPTLAAIDHVADACLIADHARIVARAGRRDIA